MWKGLTGERRGSYYRRLVEADRLAAEYPEVAIARSQARQRAADREREKAEAAEARRVTAWEQVKRLNGRF